MKKMLLAAAALAAFGSTTAVHAQSPAPTAGAQGVYTTVSTTEIVNSDGSVTEIHVVTLYYVFGYE